MQKAELIVNLKELERNRFNHFIIERLPQSKINAIWPRLIVCEGFFPENSHFKPVSARGELSFFKEGEGWFHYEELGPYGRGPRFDLKSKEGKVIIHLRDMIDHIFWHYTYGSPEDRDPELVKQLKRATKLRLKIKEVTCERIGPSQESWG